MKNLFMIMLFFASSAYAENAIYTNAEYGFSFEHPKATEIVDKSKNGNVQVLFYVVDWPKEYKEMEPKPPSRPVNGVRLYTASKTEEFDTFIISDRKNQDSTGATVLVSENRTTLESGVPVLETVRSFTQIDNMIAHYIYFPSQNNETVLGLAYIEKTGSGIMIYPDDEKKALEAFNSIKKTLRYIE